MNRIINNSFFLLVTIELLWILLFPSLLLGREKVAVTTKVRGIAELKSYEKKSFSPVKPPTVLFDKDKIRTGTNGFLTMVYLDDKSQLKIKENTDLEIRGTRSREGISKIVDLTAGILKADIPKERKGDFVISTPISVASVKGTVFYLVSDPVIGDQVFSIEGIVELKNLISGKTIQVLANQTGTSLRNGSLNVSITNPSNIPLFEGEETIEINELRIKLENIDGEEKEIIIQYR